MLLSSKYGPDSTESRHSFSLGSGKPTDIRPWSDVARRNRDAVAPSAASLNLSAAIVCTDADDGWSDENGGRFRGDLSIISAKLTDEPSGRNGNLSDEVTQVPRGLETKTKPSKHYRIGTGEIGRVVELIPEVWA